MSDENQVTTYLLSSDITWLAYIDNSLLLWHPNWRISKLGSQHWEQGNPSTRFFLMFSVYSWRAYCFWLPRIWMSNLRRSPWHPNAWRLDILLTLVWFASVLEEPVSILESQILQHLLVSIFLISMYSHARVSLLGSSSCSLFNFQFLPHFLCGESVIPLNFLWSNTQLHLHCS